MKARVSLNRSSWNSAGSRRFFSAAGPRPELGEPIGKGDELLGQRIEKPEVLHLLFDLSRLGCRNALGTLFTLEGALQDEIGPGLNHLAVASGFEELAAE
jgi:hypothetical protein